MNLTVTLGMNNGKDSCKSIVHATGLNLMTKPKSRSHLKNSEFKHDMRTEFLAIIHSEGFKIEKKLKRI